MTDGGIKVDTGDTTALVVVARVVDSRSDVLVEVITGVDNSEVV